MKNETILVVEDDADIRHLLQLYLRQDYHVIVAGTGNEALEFFHSDAPALILLDILLPGMDGLAVCREIRTYSEEVPILFLSSRSEYEDRIYGLEAGADDYIIKPFDPGEVLARVKAHLRRKEISFKKAYENASKMKLGELEIDMDTYIVLRNGEPVQLYAKEIQLLFFLIQNPNQVFSNIQLYEHIWGEDKFGDYKTVKVHISNIRKKLEKNPANPEFIITVRGFGYKFLPKN
ncbi:response regulator transcription factor [Oceanobacillus massiliensis]|uniref:response regulator transcription factor n=1 Tax=Oceanobacillus massiliensis TaxID=1465765 RepID=UPI000289A9A4|nr:response regulator transcription factor [Oceanobacillus massiliensis]